VPAGPGDPPADRPAARSRSGEPAGYGLRLLAFVIDGIASDLVALTFTRPPSAAYTTAVYVIFIVEIIVLTALTGASFGQWVVGLRVHRLDGNPVGFRAAIIRTVLLALVVPVLLTDREGRGLHDRAAGTDIVRR
jgi:uncharacterized RDD family membrane protein YckC